MNTLRNNRILISAITGMLAFFTLATPLSLTLTSAFDVEIHLAYAQEEGFFAGLGKTAALFIGNLLLSGAAAILGVAGNFFDTTIEWFVRDMGIHFQEKFGSVIDEMWIIMRDIANIVFIFGFVYIGIATIIGGLERAGTKRFLAQLIIAAILINFSLFFTKLIVDFTNVLALEVYNNIQEDTGEGIAIGFTKAMGLTTLWDPLSAEKLEGMTGDASIPFFIAATAVLLIVAFVFLAAGVMLFIRFIAIILIMIFSPFLFAAQIFPKTKPLGDKLLSALVSYTLYAPAFLFFIFLSLKILNTLPSANASALFDAVSEPKGAGDVIIRFGMATLFIIIALRVGQMLSIAGGAQAVKIGNNIRQRGQRFMGDSTAGMAARFGRRTVGAAGHAVTKSKWAQSLAARGGIAGAAGRTALVAGKRTSEASLDARRIAGIGKAIGIGEGKKGGHAQVLKDTAKREKEIAGMLGYDADKVQNIETAGKEKDRQFAESIRSKKTELRAKTQPLLDRLKNQTEIAADTTKSDTERQDARDEIKSIETNLQAIREEIQTEIDTLQEERKATSEQNKQAIANEKNKLRKQYAQNLKTRGGAVSRTSLDSNIFTDLYNLLSAGQTAREEASAAILKEISKSDNDKLLDKLGELGGKLENSGQNKKEEK